MTIRLPPIHPQRVSLHNEVHARPPEAMNMPLAISHVVMQCDAAQLEASRAHLATLLLDHHLPIPDTQTIHVRLELGSFRLRWEQHTEFVTWTFSRAVELASIQTGEPDAAIKSVPRDWFAALPGQCLQSLHLWVLGVRRT